MQLSSGNRRANGGSNVEKMFWGWKLSSGVLFFSVFVEINKEGILSEHPSNTLVLKPSISVCTH